MTRPTHFGLLLREERKRKCIPLWKFAASIPFPQSNIQRMESGVSEPKLGLAVRMINALGVNVGECMATLMREQGWGASPFILPVGQSSGSPQEALSAENMPESSGSPAVIFGFLLKQARLANNLSQTKIAEASGYTVRSLISVEKGRQEPRLTTALRLVWATGYDAVSFFDAYIRLLRL